MHGGWCACAESLSCVRLLRPIDYTIALPDSSVHEIPQARILEWAAVSFSRGSSQPQDQIRVSCIAGGFITMRGTREAQLTVGAQ